MRKARPREKMRERSAEESNAELRVRKLRANDPGPKLASLFVDFAEAARLML